jgi:hypothetical protein
MQIALLISTIAYITDSYVVVVPDMKNYMIFDHKGAFIPNEEVKVSWA